MRENAASEEGVWCSLVHFMCYIHSVLLKVLHVVLSFVSQDIQLGSYHMCARKSARVADFPSTNWIKQGVIHFVAVECAQVHQIKPKLSACGQDDPLRVLHG